VTPQSTTRLVIIITLICMVVFALAPELDLAVARIFFRDGGFVAASTALGDAARRFFWDAPYGVLALALALYALRRMGRVSRGPDGRAIVFLVLTLALGPGLLLNGALKEHSGRPRPVFTQEFGGAWAFRPWNDFRGECDTNCSFASGETGTAAWTLAPALLTPPPARIYAVAGALVFTAGAGALRVAFGGHYLSDVLFAALFTILIVLAGYRWYSRGAKNWI